MIRFPAEWENQSFVQIVFPHEKSDWAPYLGEAQETFKKIALAIARFEPCLIVCQNARETRTFVGEHNNLVFAELPSNDTWSRDFGAITVEEDGQTKLLDFGFNGWGLKFASNLDNQITRKLHKRGIFGDTPLETVGLILEGGSIESDGKGTILTTSACLCEANRNPHLDRKGIEAALKEHLGARQVLWLDHGYLAGDDTDSHIDTLARLVDEKTIAYIRCDDPADEHYEALKKMEEQLQTFRTLDGTPYRLVPLPWIAPKYYDDERLPATYANFLIINGAVLVPTYKDQSDKKALKIFREIFPGREIIPIDCSVLIRQHGSLHCVTMQYPKGVVIVAQDEGA